MEEGPSQYTFKKNILLPFAFASGLMVSPDTFVRLGSFTAKTELFGTTLIAGFAFFYLKNLFKLPTETSLSEKHISDFAIFFHFWVKSIAVVFLATGLLVTSGFTFNEVFLYWFPNFGFAFLLLGILTGLQFLSQKFIFYVQLLFIAIPIFGLLILIIAAFVQAPPHALNLSVGSLFNVNQSNINTLFLPLLFFVGFDLGFNEGKKDHKTIPHQMIGPFLSVVFIGLSLVLWGLVSLHFIPLEKLLSTTIPHMKVAKSILGTPGRYLMGLMVISGSMAAIHAIFTSIANNKYIFKKKPPAKLKFWSRQKSFIIILALIIGALMAGGLAGDEDLDVFTTAVLILWLISYAVTLRSKYFFNKNISPSKKICQKIKNAWAELILSASVLILIVTDENFLLMLKFLFFAFVMIIILWMAAVFKKNHRKN